MSLIVVPVATPNYPYALKKEDLPQLIEKQRKEVVVGIWAFILLSITMQLFALILTSISPLSDMFGANARSPMFLNVITAVSLFVGVILITFLLRQEFLNTNLVQELQNSKEEILSIKSDLKNKKPSLIAGIYFMIGMILMALLFLLTSAPSA